LPPPPWLLHASIAVALDSPAHVTRAPTHVGGRHCRARPSAFPAGNLQALLALRPPLPLVHLADASIHCAGACHRHSQDLVVQGPRGRGARPTRVRAVLVDRPQLRWTHVVGGGPRGRRFVPCEMGGGKVNPVPAHPSVSPPSVPFARFLRAP